MRACLTIRDWLFPIPNLDDKAAGAFTRVSDEVTPQYLNTERRRNAYYLSTLIIDPKRQKTGLGSVLLKDGLRRVEEETPGAASWLVSVHGAEPFYNRVGFAEVGRMNVGELAEWTGGVIMFRE